MPTHLPSDCFSPKTVLDTKVNIVYVPVNLILKIVSQGNENNDKKRSMVTHLCTPYGLSRIGSLNGGGIWPK